MRTPRLDLRLLDVADIPALVDLDADPEVRRYLTSARPPSSEEVAAMVERTRGWRWAGLLREGGTFVGWFALDPSGDGEYELGYRLRREFWGRGLASEGAGALVRHAFDDLGAQRVWGQTMAVNVASRRVMERCGMTYVRTFFADWGEVLEGSEQGDVEYELRRPTTLCEIFV